MLRFPTNGGEKVNMISYAWKKYKKTIIAEIQLFFSY